MKRTVIAIAVAAAIPAANAIDFTGLTPPDAPAQEGTNTFENTAPFVLNDGWTQQKVIDADTLRASKGLGNQAYPDLDQNGDDASGGENFDNYDMLAVDGEYLYIPMESGNMAGAIRYDRISGKFAALLVGDGSGNFDRDPGDGFNALTGDYGAIDPAVLTPIGTLVLGEEWSGAGRIFEVLNPKTASGVKTANVRWLPIPSVRHEGIKFDSNGNMYFIDELTSGSVYKYVPAVPGDLSAGQTFVLVDDDYQANGGNPAENYNSTGNAGADRNGSARWVPITDSLGLPLTVADPYDYVNHGGSAAADEVGGTPYGRPEDMAVGVVNGNEALFLSVTSEDKVIAIELMSSTTANVTDFVTTSTIEAVSGSPVGNGGGSTYGFNDPDNVAIGPDGNIFIVEDQNPGDIWMAIDADHNGIAESIKLFASLGAAGSEPSGLIYDPMTGGFVVSIQHPSSDNDAVWAILPERSRAASGHGRPGAASHTLAHERGRYSRTWPGSNRIWARRGLQQLSTGA